MKKLFLLLAMGFAFSTPSYAQSASAEAAINAFKKSAISALDELVENQAITAEQKAIALAQLDTHITTYDLRTKVMGSRPTRVYVLLNPDEWRYKSKIAKRKLALRLMLQMSFCPTPLTKAQHETLDQILKEKRP